MIPGRTIFMYRNSVIINSSSRIQVCVGKTPQQKVVVILGDITGCHIRSDYSGEI